MISFRACLAIALLPALLHGTFFSSTADAQEGLAPPPIVFARSDQVTEMTLGEWLALLEETSGKSVSFPSVFGRESEIVFRVLGDSDSLIYPVVKAVFQSNGYDITEELRSDIVQVRHARQRIRSRLSERKVADADDAFSASGETYTWLCSLEYLEAEGTFETLRQLLRIRARQDGEGSAHLEVRPVASTNMLVMTGDSDTLTILRKMVEELDARPVGSLPLLRCYTPHHSNAEETALRVRKTAGFPFLVLNDKEELQYKASGKTPGQRLPNKNGDYARLLVLPSLKKIVVDTNLQEYLELIDVMMPLIDRRDPVMRANTFLYRARHKPADILTKNLREFIWSGGITAAKADSFPTRIVLHERTNSILVQAPAERYDEMLEFLQSVDTPSPSDS